MEHKDNNQPEVIDIEEFAKAGKQPPKDSKYRIRIDKEKYVVDVPGMTGRDLLILAGKNPEQNSIYEKLRCGQSIKIGLDEMADFTKNGVERFMTLPLDQTEG